MDPLAREYRHLALAAGTHYDGIVDAYYGPPELRTEAERNPPPPAALADHAIEPNPVQVQTWRSRLRSAGSGA